MPTFEKGSSIHHGSGIIRRTTSRRYCAEFNSDGKRRRKSFDTKSRAEEWLVSMGAARRDEGKGFVQLTSRQSDDALRAIRHLHERGLSADLFSCIEFYTKHHQAEDAGATLNLWFRRYIDFLSAPDDGGGSPARPRTIYGKQNRLAGFLEKFGDRHLHEITKAEIDVWLDYTGATGRNLLNYKTEIQSLFNFAEKQSHGAFKNTVARFPQRRKKEVRPADIMPPTQVKRFLHELERRDSRAALALAIGCFAGVRREEMVGHYAGQERLTWQNLDFEEKEIIVPAAITKTRDRREVPITPNLMKWLMKYRLDDNGNPRTGSIAPTHGTFARHKKAVVEKTGIRWVHNGARHSFGTYYGRLHGYRAAAEAMGHVGGMRTFMDHYKGDSNRTADAEAYFGIEPVVRQGQVLRLPRSA